MDKIEKIKAKASGDLEVAAIDFADGARKGLMHKDYAISSIADYDHGCIDGFIAGWNAHKERMLKEAVETVVHLEPGANPVIEFGVGRFGLKVRDKVKVVIVKED